VAEGKPRLAFEKTEGIMRIIIAANESREHGGEIINL
jgi:hypothetical protein